MDVEIWVSMEEVGPLYPLFVVAFRGRGPDVFDIEYATLSTVFSLLFLLLINVHTNRVTIMTMAVMVIITAPDTPAATENDPLPCSDGSSLLVSGEELLEVGESGA